MDAKTRGLIDAAKSEARLAERQRLAEILREWMANGTVADTRDMRLVSEQLLATDY